ncbi:MAG TPA: P-type conjugative transfer protein TrbJ [Stellaceae bacterium]|nr:P-type conjugative transfer protein TrbJ [Stellaceae bacterium]
MLRKSISRVIIASLLAGSMAVLPLHPVQAQVAVFDGANFSQNLLTAARALQQINNQIQQLQNQAQMLANMARNLQNLNFSSLDTMVSTLSQVSWLMDQGQGIAFDVQATEQIFAKLYPQQYASTVGTNQLFVDARQRWQNSMNAFQQTLVVQAQVARNVEADSGTLSALVNASQGAGGNLQAQQATSQLIALSIKQQLQIQQLMAAQYRATSLEASRGAEEEEEARAAFGNFLGSGTAYTPQ